MPSINVSRVVNNPKFSKKFTVYRKSGAWVAGRFQQTEEALEFYGPVLPGGTKDIISVPEADRTSQIMVFLSKEAMFVTRNKTDDKGTSDEIEWDGDRYKIVQCKPWKDFGYYRAIGVSMGVGSNV